MGCELRKILCKHCKLSWALSESDNPRNYWKVLKCGLKQEENEMPEKIR